MKMKENAIEKHLKSITISKFMENNDKALKIMFQCFAFSTNIIQ